METKLVPASVITHAVSPDSYFPLWYNYYGKNVGHKNLYVITNNGASRLFHDFDLGGIWEVNSTFDDGRRARIASALASALLVQSKVVINVDTDEFAVPNPEKHDSLAAYIEAVKAPYVTGMGMNVMQLIGEPALNPNDPILYSQRKWVVPRSALNKTCYIAEPTAWGPGFHWCSHFPKFHDLFLFHFKYADDDIRNLHGVKMVELFSGNSVKEKYYSPGKEIQDRVKHTTATFKALSGMAEMYRHEFNSRFLSEVEFHRMSRLYSGKDIFEDVRIELPPSFSKLL